MILRTTKDESKKEKDPLLKWVVPVLYLIGLGLVVLFLIGGVI